MTKDTMIPDVLSRGATVQLIQSMIDSRVKPLEERVKQLESLQLESEDLLPKGGFSGDVLTKRSAADHDCSWDGPQSGGNGETP